MEFTGERYVPGIGGSIALEHEHRYRFCLALANGQRVLDIACGEGFGADMLADRADKVWGVDIDQFAVAHARKTYIRNNLSFLVGACSAVPLPDASVDVVVSFETIEHHDEHEAMMLEIRRVLRPGGVLVISSPDKRVYSDERRFRNEFHVRELYAEEFDALLKSHFRHVKPFGQRIVYGSAVLPQYGAADIKTFGIGSTKAVTGLDAPMYQIAIASDDPAWASLAQGGLLEESVFRSEAAVEARIEAQKAIRDLQDRLVDIKRIEGQAQDLQVASGALQSEVDKLQRQVGTLQRSVEVLRNERTILRDTARQQTHIAKAHWEEVMSLRLSLEIQSGWAEEWKNENERLWRAWYGSTWFRRTVFHRSGRPRGWVRRLVLSDKVGTPRPATRRILFKKNGSVRPCFARWYSQYTKAEVAEDRPDYAAFLRARMEDGTLARAGTLHVVTTPHTEFIGKAIKAALKDTRLRVTTATEMPESFDDDLYVIVAPQMFKTLPPPEKRILFQMEQVSASSWVDSAYMERMAESLAVFDYSKANIATLVDRNLSYKQLYFVPIRPMSLARPPESERDIDVLFYGAIASPRRGAYLNALAERVNLRVESDTFGPTLHGLLDRTKVVVNIHFYENALLETTRLSEALSHGAHVVSEEATDQADQGAFSHMVEFVPVGQIEEFVRRVEAALMAWTAPVSIPDTDGFSGTAFHLLRALHGLGILSLDELQIATVDLPLPSNRLILALPEQSERYDHAIAHRLPGAVAFHGLRNIDGWKGCAMSYKFMATHALAQNLPRLMIYEEDAVFPPGAKARLEEIERYLDRRDNSWDLFSGLLTDLTSDAVIKNVTTDGNEEIIELDSVIGMVFGIYNRTALQMLADFEFSGGDTMKHTIDRYLEDRRPHTVTVWPPLVGHAEDLNSSLWSVRNSHVTPMIESSINRLVEKKNSFLAEIEHH